jgi:hypothetical protein
VQAAAEAQQEAWTAAEATLNSRIGDAESRAAAAAERERHTAERAQVCVCMCLSVCVYLCVCLKEIVDSLNLQFAGSVQQGGSAKQQSGYRGCCLKDAPLFVGKCVNCPVYQPC